MIERVLADGLVLIHLLFVGFALFGGVGVWWKSWWPRLHLPAALWAALVEFQGWICPLTTLEQALRLAAGDAGYQGSFVDRYLVPVLYPPGLTSTHQLVLGMVVVAVNLLIYGLAWKRSC